MVMARRLAGTVAGDSRTFAARAPVQKLNLTDVGPAPNVRREVGVVEHCHGPRLSSPCFAPRDPRGCGCRRCACGRDIVRLGRAGAVPRQGDVRAGSSGLVRGLVLEESNPAAACARLRCSYPHPHRPWRACASRSPRRRPTHAYRGRRQSAAVRGSERCRPSREQLRRDGHHRCCRSGAGADRPSRLS
jgi:hypothetical protein